MYNVRQTQQGLIMPSDVQTVENSVEVVDSGYIVTFYHIQHERLSSPLGRSKMQSWDHDSMHG